MCRQTKKKPKSWASGAVTWQELTFTMIFGRREVMRQQRGTSLIEETLQLVLLCKRTAQFSGVFNYALGYVTYGAVDGSVNVSHRAFNILLQMVVISEWAV